MWVMYQKRKTLLFFVVILFMWALLLGCATSTDSQDNPHFDINNNYHKTVLMNYANAQFIEVHPNVYEKTFMFEENSDSVTLKFEWTNQSQNSIEEGFWEIDFNNDTMIELFGDI